MKFPIDRIPSCPILKFWDFGRIMAVGQNWLKIVILAFFYHHYEISEPSCPILEKWDFGRIRE
jgi:hypothetical protein